MAQCRKLLPGSSPGDYVLQVNVQGSATAHGDRAIGVNVVEEWKQTDLVPVQPHPFKVAPTQMHIIQIFATFVNATDQVIVALEHAGATLAKCVLQRDDATSATITVVTPP